MLLAWAVVRACERVAAAGGRAADRARLHDRSSRAAVLARAVDRHRHRLRPRAGAARVAAGAGRRRSRTTSFVPDERGRGASTLRKALVVAEVALSLLLLVAAGLFIRSLQRATRRSIAGFDAGKLLTAPLNVNLLRYTRAAGPRVLPARDRARRAPCPGVEVGQRRARRGAQRRRIACAACTSKAAQTPDNAVPQRRRRRLRGAAGATRSARTSSAPGYFQTMGIGLDARTRFRRAGRRDGAARRRSSTESFVRDALSRRGARSASASASPARAGRGARSSASCATANT